MKCRSVKKRLHALRDGEVGPELEARLKAHLGACDRCRSAFEAIEDLWGLLEDYPEIDVPEGFSRRVAARAEAEEAERGFRGSLRWRWRLEPLSWATAFVFLGGLLIGGVLFHTWSGRMNRRLASYYASTQDPYEFESSYGLAEQSLIDSYWKVLTADSDGET